MSKRTKKLLVCVAAFMAVVFTVALLAKATANFENLFSPGDWSIQELNEDNLYQTLKLSADVKNGMIADGAKGIMIEIDDNNVIKIDGTADENVTYTVGTVTLAAGTYVFDSDLTKGSKGTVYVSLMNGDAEVACSYRGEVVFTLATESTLTMTVTVTAETEVEQTLKPVICVGAEADDLVSYYK